MRILTGSLLLAVWSLSTAAFGQVKVSVQALGVWCTSCTNRLEKSLQRVDGVQKVRAAVQPPRAEVTPRAGAWVDAERLRKAVKDAGFRPGDVRARGRRSPGEVARAAGAQLPGSQRILVLQAAAGTPEPFERLRQLQAAADSATVKLEGEFVERADPADKASPPALRLLRLEVGG